MQQNRKLSCFQENGPQKLYHPDEALDFYMASNEPVNLIAVKSVLKPGGRLLISFSMNRSDLVRSRNKIENYLQQNGMKLLEIQTGANDAHLLLEKDETFLKD